MTEICGHEYLLPSGGSHANNTIVILQDADRLKNQEGMAEVARISDMNASFADENGDGLNSV